MFSIELLKTLGAKVILITMVIPWLFVNTDAISANSKKVYDNSKDIAVIKAGKPAVTRHLERIERKLDAIQKHLLKDK